ncbi:MAG: hypothetical protein ABEH43_02970 [Flavobacteriales bacterium]
MDLLQKIAGELRKLREEQGLITPRRDFVRQKANRVDLRTHERVEKCKYYPELGEFRKSADNRNVVLRLVSGKFRIERTPIVLNGRKTILFFLWN